MPPTYLQWVDDRHRARVPTTYDADGRAIGLILEDPATTVEPLTPDKPALLTRRGDGAEFLTHWRFGDWNQLRVRCVGGALPTITTWVNDVLVAEIDLAMMRHPRFDREAVAEMLGSSGHIAFEVHDNDPQMGDQRWAPGARCRWRDVRIREL